MLHHHDSVENVFMEPSSSLPKMYSVLVYDLLQTRWIPRGVGHATDDIASFSISDNGRVLALGVENGKTRIMERPFVCRANEVLARISMIHGNHDEENAVGGWTLSRAGRVSSDLTLSGQVVGACKDCDGLFFRRSNHTDSTFVSVHTVQDVCIPRQDDSECLVLNKEANAYSIRERRNKKVTQLPLASVSSSCQEETITCPTGQTLFMFSYFTDLYPSENRWVITKQNENDDEVVFSDGPFDTPYTNVRKEHCLDDEACYTFQFIDSNEDGIRFGFDVVYGHDKTSVYNVQGRVYTKTLGGASCRPDIW